MKTNIFKMIALILWLGLWQTGCYPDKFDPEGDEVGPIATLDFSNPSVEFKASAESRTVTVATNYKSYRVDVPEEAAGWCRVTADGMTLTIAVDENPYSRERSATISVTVAKGSKELTKTVSVFQAGTLPQVKYSPSQLIFKQKEAATEEVVISTNQDEWVYKVVGGDAAWFEVTRSGDKLQIVPKGDNPEKGIRKGYINLTSSSEAAEETATGSITVEQLGTDPALRLSENAFSLAADGGERRVRVVTNQPEWQLHTPPAEWYDTRVEGDEVVIAVKRNTGGDARKSELTVATPNGKVYANLSLAQLGTAISLEVSADTIAVDASEAYSTLWVTTNVDEWKTVVTGGADWCELMVDANTATVYTKAYDNTTTARECTITFTAGSLQKTVRVIQLPDMTLTLNHDTLQMNPAGETRNVLVLTNQSSWSFTVDAEIAGWCSAAANGNTLVVTATANGGSPRSGEIVVSVGEPGMEKNVTLAVTQEGFSDRETLIAFYNATGGPNWTNRTNWCSDRPLSEWYGVSCNENGRVVELDLDGEDNEYGIPAGNNLTGSIPVCIGDLSELQILNLSYNQLKGSIPSEMGKLVRLTKLEINCNYELTGPIPKEWGNLIQLQTLRVVACPLIGTIPSELGNLKELVSLGFGNNANFDPQPFPVWILGLTKLKSIFLLGCNLTGEFPIKLTEMQNLENIHLSNNNLTGSIPKELGKMSQLCLLELGRNQFTGSIPSELSQLSKLYLLDLSDNQLSGGIPVELGQLSHLYQLWLSNNNLTGNVPKELGNLTSLITGEYALKISGNRLTGEFPEEVKRLPNWNTFNAEETIYPQQEGYGFTQGGGSTMVDDVYCVSSGENIISVNVSSVGTPSVDIPGEYSWLKCVSSVNGGISTLQFSVDANTTRDYRKGFITVRENGIARSIGVYQGVGDSLWIHVKTPETLRALVGKERLETTCGLKLSGMLGEDDYAAIRYAMPNVVSYDMEELENTRIPNLVFNGKSITRLVLPARLEEIGNQAFHRCHYKGELKFPETVRVIESSAFANSDISGNLKLPSGLKEIGTFVFHSCQNLRGDLVLPDGLENISANAFQYSGFDGNLVLPAGCVEIGEAAFGGCSSLTGNVVIPNNVKKIGIDAFANCSKITGLTLSSSLEEIGKEAFERCYALMGNLVIPSSVRSIGNSAFANCGFNGSLVLSSGLETIGWHAFQGCPFTGNLSIPSTVTEIGTGAFQSCRYFTGDLVIPGSVKVISSSAFSGCEGFDGKLVLTEGVEEIQYSAFRECKGLSGNLVLPSSLRKIGEDAFNYCSAFTGNLVIPEGVTEINSYAFLCDGIGNTVTLPSTLTYLGTRIFADSIQYVYCNRKEPLPWSTILRPFGDASKRTLIVPKGSFEAYKAAEMWNEFGVIKEED